MTGMNREPGMAAKIAAELRAELGRRRMSGRELARITGVPVSTMSRWLSGVTPMGIDELDTVARALDMTVIDLWQAAAMSRPFKTTTDDPGCARGDSNSRPTDYKVAVSRPSRPLPVQPGVTLQGAA